MLLEKIHDYGIKNRSIGVDMSTPFEAIRKMAANN
jgi:hypothetical protein